MTMKKQNNKKQENKQSQLTEEINYIERLINDDDYIDSYGEGLLNNIKAKLTNHKQLTNKKHWYSVDGIEALEKMMNMTKQTISNAQNFTQPERPLTLEDVRSMMKDKRYFDPKERDESYVRKVDDAFARLYRG